MNKRTGIILLIYILILNILLTSLLVYVVSTPPKVQIQVRENKTFINTTEKIYEKMYIYPPYLKIDSINKTDLDTTSDNLWLLADESSAQYIALCDFALRRFMHYELLKNPDIVLNPIDSWNLSKGNCENYALIMDYLAKRKGIESNYITGKAYSESGRYLGKHARTEVKFEVDSLDIKKFEKEYTGIDKGIKII